MLSSRNRPSPRLVNPPRLEPSCHSKSAALKGQLGIGRIVEVELHLEAGPGWNDFIVVLQTIDGRVAVAIEHHTVADLDHAGRAGCQPAVSAADPDPADRRAEQLAYVARIFCNPAQSLASRALLFGHLGLILVPQLLRVQFDVAAAPFSAGGVVE